MLGLGRSRQFGRFAIGRLALARLLLVRLVLNPIVLGRTGVTRTGVARAVRGGARVTGATIRTPLGFPLRRR